MMLRTLTLLALLATAACAGTPGLVAGDAPQVRQPPRLAGLSDTPMRRGGMRVLAWEGTGRGCGLSVLDDPALAQRLVAATYAEGSREMAVPVLACDRPFRAL